MLGLIVHAFFSGKYDYSYLGKEKKVDDTFMKMTHYLESQKTKIK